MLTKKEERKLIAVMQENIKGVIFRNELSDWFCKMQEVQDLGYNIQLNEVINVAESLGIKVAKSRVQYNLLKDQYESYIKWPEEKIKPKNQRTPKRLITKEQILELYEKENLTQRQVAEKLKLSMTTINTWFKIYDIPLKKVSRKIENPLLTKEVLTELYVNQKLSSSDIGKIYHLSPATVCSALVRNDIKPRTISEAMKVKIS